jgi:glycogen debranching enzyme
MVNFNPMSYHNGSVWPHDNSLITAGLRRYGFVEQSTTLTTALVDAAATDPLLRLPELFCGFPREDGFDRGPVPYPVSCRPQAWAAAAIPHLVTTMLDLRIDLETGRATIDPALPVWLSELVVQGLSVRGVRSSLAVRRKGDRYAVTCDGPIELVP